MKIPISKARAKLPQIIKELEKNPDVIFEITVHDSVVAELKAPPRIEPGVAARKLLEAMKQLPRAEAPGTVRVSEKIDHYLYGKKK